MPFPNRAPGALFTRRMKSVYHDPPPQVEKIDAAPVMRLFPLEIEPARQADARARRVNPLPPPTQPSRHNITNALGQSIPVQSFAAQGGGAQGNHAQGFAAQGISPQGNHAQMPPPAPRSPENAAAQFRQINKNLPDGVHYEPLDEETLRLLREHGHLPAPGNEAGIEAGNVAGSEVAEVAEAIEALPPSQNAIEASLLLKTEIEETAISTEAKKNEAEKPDLEPLQPPTSKETATILIKMLQAVQDNNQDAYKALLAKLT